MITVPLLATGPAAAVQAWLADCEQQDRAAAGGNRSQPQRRTLVYRGCMSLQSAWRRGSISVQSCSCCEAGEAEICPSPAVQHHRQPRRSVALAARAAQRRNGVTAAPRIKSDAPVVAVCLSLGLAIHFMLRIRAEGGTCFVSSLLDGEWCESWRESWWRRHHTRCESGGGGDGWYVCASPDNELPSHLPPQPRRAIAR